MGNNACADTCDQTVVDTQALLADAEEQLDATLAELASVNARIEAGQAQRDMEHAAWSELDAEHESGVTACKDAVNLVASLSRGALFIQLQGRIKSVSKRLSDMTHLNDKFTAYAPLINSFAQIDSSSNNPQLLAQITQLLTTLKNQIASTRAADAGWEDRKAAAWAKELAGLTAQRDALTERRNSLQAKSSTITTSSKRTPKNLKCTELRPSNSNTSSKNKLPGAMPNKPLMMKLLPTEMENFPSSDKSETTSPREWVLLKNSLWLNFPFDRTE